MVEFVRFGKIHGPDQGTVYARITDLEEALFLWKRSIELNIAVHINGENFGNTVGAYEAINEHFKNLNQNESIQGTV